MAGQNPPPQQVLHVRGDSDSELQALFDSVLQPGLSSRPRPLPFRMRNLPDSFFNPPNPRIARHSRDNSLDILATPQRRSSPVHHRAHSSPATLEQTFSVAPSPPSSNASFADDPLPPGWEQACTAEGQIYFINHHMKSTTWEDPRKAQHAEILAAVGEGGGAAPAVLGPLPQGWEQSRTAEGQIYFIHHDSERTSWFDPRLPAHLQRPPMLAQQINSAAAHLAGGQEARLAQLTLEREQLRARQAEIRRQMELEAGRRREKEDPLLCHAGDPHSRQESADSGLGLNTFSSVPPTPEDFLSEEMMSIDGLDGNGELGLLEPSAEELVPSLQLGDELSNELLDEMQSMIKQDAGPGLTWL